MQFLDEHQVAAKRCDHDRRIAKRVLGIHLCTGPKERIDRLDPSRTRGDDQHGLAVGIDGIRIHAAREQCDDVVGTIDGDRFHEPIVERLLLRLSERGDRY
jgi:hypothetical protein